MRRVGVGRVQAANKEKKIYQEKGHVLTEANTEHIEKQMAQFKEQLEKFAVKHKKQINKDPEFRSKFQNMCAKIGVDPLSSNKGFWAEILGVGSFYFELGVQIVHICLATRDVNGGVITLKDLVQYLQKIRKGKSSQVVIEEDVKRAVGTLEPLGNGIRLVQVGLEKMVLSVPLELNSDHTAILNVAQKSNGQITMNQITQSLGWTVQRAMTTINVLQQQGMIWIDIPKPSETSPSVAGDCPEIVFWFPSITLSLL